MASGTEPGIAIAKATAALVASAFLGCVVGITVTFAVLGMTDLLSVPIQRPYAIMAVSIVVIVVAGSLFGLALHRWIRAPVRPGPVAAQPDATVQGLGDNRVNPGPPRQPAVRPIGRPTGHTASEPVSASTRKKTDHRAKVHPRENQKVGERPAASSDSLSREIRLGQRESSSTEHATSSGDQALAQTAPESGIQPAAGIAAAGPSIDPDTLVVAWDAYRSRGDGHFNSEGLQRAFDDHGIDADVMKGESIGAGDQVLVVVERNPGSRHFLVPNFTKSPKSVADWFDDQSDGALTGRVRKLVKLAEGRTQPGTTDFDLVVRGCVA